MTIERIGPVDPVSKYQKTGRAAKVVQKSSKDKIDVSSEAKTRAEIYRVMEEVKSTPDIRTDRVEEIKRKLQDPDYINDTVLNITADRILDVFDI